MLSQAGDGTPRAYVAGMNADDVKPDLFQRAALALREAQRLRDDVKRTAAGLERSPGASSERQVRAKGHGHDVQCAAARAALQAIMREVDDDPGKGLAAALPAELRRVLIERATVACFYSRVGDPGAVRAELQTLLTMAQSLPLKGPAKPAVLGLRRRLRLALAATPAVPYRGPYNQSGGQPTTS